MAIFYNSLTVKLKGKLQLIIQIGAGKG